MYPNEENKIVVPITKRIKIIMGILVSLISMMNFDYKENSGKKAFLRNPKHEYRLSEWGEHDCSANNEKNGDYYEYQNLSHFTDEL